MSVGKILNLIRTEGYPGTIRVFQRQRSQFHLGNVPVVVFAPAPAALCAFAFVYRTGVIATGGLTVFIPYIVGYAVVETEAKAHILDGLIGQIYKIKVYIYVIELMGCLKL